MRREVLDQDLARRELNVSDQDSARRAAAVYFYAVSSNVNLDPSDHEQYVTIPAMSNYPFSLHKLFSADSSFPSLEFY